MNPLQRLLILFCLSTLTACSLTPTPEPVSTYKLTPESNKPLSENQTVLNLSLRINKPNASGYLATSRLVVMTQDQQLSVYKGAQWHEATPLMIRNQLLDSFRQANLVAFVSSDDKQLVAQVELDSDLREFQTQYHNGKAQVSIILVVRLVNPQQKRILASRTFSEQLEARSAELPDVVSAFSRAQNQLSQSVITWTQQTLSTTLATP